MVGLSPFFSCCQQLLHPTVTGVRARKKGLTDGAAAVTFARPMDCLSQSKELIGVETSDASRQSARTEVSVCAIEFGIRCAVRCGGETGREGVAFVAALGVYRVAGSVG